MAAIIISFADGILECMFLNENCCIVGLSILLSISDMGASFALALSLPMSVSFLPHKVPYLT